MAGGHQSLSIIVAPLVGFINQKILWILRDLTDNTVQTAVICRALNVYPPTPP